jgi:enoyl-CoA hydratase/carnithine racemase
LHTAFVNLPEDVKAVVISGEGTHFCAGLDLSELVERDIHSAVLHSRMWHAASTPSSSAACRWWRRCTARWSAAGWNWPRRATSAWPTDAYYGLPEGQRGIFVGGGGSARIPRLMGVARMTDLMMTGRVYDADEGVRWACRSTSWPKARRWPRRWRWPRAWPERADEQLRRDARAAAHRRPEQSEGLFTESLMAAVAESTPEAQDRLRAFLEGRAGKVVKHHERAATADAASAAASRPTVDAARRRLHHRALDRGRCAGSPTA